MTTDVSQEIVFGTSDVNDKSAILDLLIHCFTVSEPVTGSLAKQGGISAEFSPFLNLMTDIQH